MNNALELDQVSISIDGRQIIREVTLKLSEGEIGCLLGASGCGKTTLLRGIAGFEHISSGTIRIGGHTVSEPAAHVPPERRQVGMVFQDYALFPHLSISANIRFGLQHLSRGDRDRRVDEVASMLKITELLSEFPHRLSGGQQQRVALARAIAPRPRILLMDEPFSGMDIGLREQIAREIRQVLKQDGITAILVSHNQHEAFAMADHVGVMQTGRLLQWDTSFRLYHFPADPHVADFVGEGVFLPGKVIDKNLISIELGNIEIVRPLNLSPGMSVSVLIRPDDIVHDHDSNSQAVVLDKAFRGAEYLYTLGLESGASVLSLVPSHHNHAVGEKIGIRFKLEHLVVFPLASTR